MQVVPEHVLRQRQQFCVLALSRVLPPTTLTGVLPALLLSCYSAMAPVPIPIPHPCARAGHALLLLYHAGGQAQ